MLRPMLSGTIKAQGILHGQGSFGRIEALPGKAIATGAEIHKARFI